MTMKFFFDVVPPGAIPVYRTESNKTLYSPIFDVEFTHKFSGPVSPNTIEECSNEFSEIWRAEMLSFLKQKQSENPEYKYGYVSAISWSFWQEANNIMRVKSKVGFVAANEECGLPTWPLEKIAQMLVMVNI